MFPLNCSRLFGAFLRLSYRNILQGDSTLKDFHRYRISPLGVPIYKLPVWSKSSQFMKSGGFFNSFREKVQRDMNPSSTLQDKTNVFNLITHFFKKFPLGVGFYHSFNL